MGARKAFYLGVRFAVVLTLCVIVLGAYVRLSDAGLGCPDWPGCYGRLVAPSQAPLVEQANLAFPERPVEIGKAWKEMVHRYAAGILGLVVLGLALLAWRRRKDPGQPVMIPILLVALIVFQSLLGMWTVTLQLKPVIVMAHLLGGLSTLALLWILVLRTARRTDSSVQQRLGERGYGFAGARFLPWAALAAVVLVMQIALGGWTSANYAALACPDFPQCQQQWWPETDFSEGFVLWRGTSVDYEFGVLDGAARTAIHMAHRIGAVVTLLVIGGLALMVLLRAGAGRTRQVAGVMLLLLLLQIALGISNIVFYLPLPVAVVHNGVAALLLLSVLTLMHALAQGAASRLHMASPATGAVGHTG
ncbi:MAG: heme A synthase [Thioalkalivibrio sp.]